MKVQIVLQDGRNRDVINVENIEDRNYFSYIDSDGGFNQVEVFEDGLMIVRKAKDHVTKLNFGKDSFVEVISKEGTLTFFIKVVEIYKNFDIISIDYRVNEDDKKIIIKYIGA